MANLKCSFLGHELKNPIGVTSCDYGGHARLAKRCIDQGAGWIIAKTVHEIDGPQRWPRPYFYSLARFGNDLKDTWFGSQMFHNMPYEQWLETEGPATLKLCRQNDVLFIGSCSGIGTDAKTWADKCRDLANLGCDMIEIDTGGPHATFGASEAHKDCGAPLALDPVKAAAITKACVESCNVPIIFKMTPQCTNSAAVALAVEAAGAGAISANNAFYGTFIDHETGTFYGGPYSGGATIGRGWIIFSLAKLMEVTCTVKIPVIGGGGAYAWDDCVRYMMGGADVAGICSAIYCRGVGVIKDMVDGMSSFMDRKGYKSVDEFKGICVPQFQYIRDWPKEEFPMAVDTPIIPVFDGKKCNACGICETICPYGALKNQKGATPELIYEYCMGCAMCQGRCPKQAINMVKKDTGELIWDGYGLPKQWCKK